METLTSAVALNLRNEPSGTERARDHVPFYDRLAWSPAEFAAGVGVSTAFVYLEIQRGRLRLEKKGRRSLILREIGLAWLNGGRPRLVAVSTGGGEAA
jgi:hypothetical protein